MNFIYVIAILFTSAFSLECAAQAIIYKPNGHSASKGFFVAKDSYEDLRFNKKQTGKIRYWSIKKGNLKIDQIFDEGKLQAIVIRKMSSTSIKEVSYRRKGTSLRLISAAERRPIVSYFSGLFKNESLKKELCENRSAYTSQIEELGKRFNVDILQQSFESKIIDPVCKKDMSKEQYESIVDSLVMSTRPENALVKCLREDRTAEIISKALKGCSVSDVKDDLNLIALKYLLEMGKFAQPSADSKPRISCERNADASGENKIAKYVEQKNIVYYTPKDPQKLTPPEELEKVSTHELLHSLDIANEEVVKNIIGICYEKAETINFSAILASEGIKTGGTGISPIPLAASQNANNKVADNTSVVMPKALAETAIPNPPPAELNQPFVESSREVRDYAANPEAAAMRAYTRSFNTTAPLINFAERIMGSSPVQAGTIATRGPASLPAAAIGSSLSATGSSSANSDGYEVVEEIDLEKGNSSVKAAVQTPAVKEQTAESKASVTKRDGYTPNTETGTGSDISSSGGSSGGASAGRASGGGGFASSAGSSSGGADRNPSSINPSSRSNASSSATTYNQKEIVNTFADYKKAKSQLSDPNFVEALKKNKITVMDMKGNVYGVRNGRIVYIEMENAYVRSK
jgi:hypothetical protein